MTWPCYILDKYVVGMLDAHRLAGLGAGRELLPRIIHGAIGHIPDHTYDRTPDSPKQAPYDEPYILPENLFHSYELTGDPQWLAMARLYLLDKEYFDPLAQGRNLLPGKHAYSHVIALSSAAKAYEVLGDAKYLDAIRNAWDMLEETQQFASGGWGPKEAFVPPHEGKLGESLTAHREHFETPCGCYAHMKLARYLLRFTGDPRYGDGLERVLYNTILGSIEPSNNGDYFYYSDYQAGARKGYYKKKWPCCSGTLVQGVADYAVSVYFQDSGGIYVNLFAPSEVRWNAGGVPVRLIQSTGYPAADSLELRVEVPAPVEFAIHVRMPAWLSGAARDLGERQERGCGGGAQDVRHGAPSMAAERHAGSEAAVPRSHGGDRRPAYGHGGADARAADDGGGECAGRNAGARRAGPALRALLLGTRRELHDVFQAAGGVRRGREERLAADEAGEVCPTAANIRQPAGAKRYFDTPSPST